MLLLVGGEAVGVLGVAGAGVGAGLWVDTRSGDAGPYAYLLGGAALGASAGAGLEVGAFRDLESFHGRALELGVATGSLVSLGLNASLDRAGFGGLTLGLGVGEGTAGWALWSHSWALSARTLWRRFRTLFA